MSLQDCIQKALRSHPDIKRFIQQVRSNQKEIDITRADYLPQISIDAEYDLTRTYIFPGNGIFNTKESDGWQAGVTFKQKIWDFARTSSLVNAQEVQQGIAELSLQDARALLAYKVKLQYELVLVQQKAIDVRKHDFQTKEALYKQAKALVDQGLKTRADASRFLSSTSIAQDNLAIAESNFSKALMMLSLYIGEPVSQDTIFEKNSINTEVYSIDEKVVLKESPVLQGLEGKIKQNEYLYQATRASRYGSIDAIASYSHLDTLNAYDATVVGVMLSIPLYTGGRLSAQEEKAFIDKQNAENEYKSKVLELKQDYRTLLYDLKRLQHTIKAKSNQYSSAQQTADVMKGRYREGLATYIEVLDAVAVMSDAELGLLQATYDRSSTIHRLEYLQGKTK
ncbi:TolC family protein [Desulfomarina profundi]|uniref:TolC family protein n=1 Tax=Desulfomarina profundi TaxID=2772557 RepID=UPI001E5B4394|nr:TolC family protein [Desulfomarina profundi]